MMFMGGNANSYPIIAINRRNYVNMRGDANPVRIWTPNGYLQAPDIVSAENLVWPFQVTMPQDLNEIRKTLCPQARRLTSAESYQFLLRMEETNPEIALDMVTGCWEATGTLLVLLPGKIGETHSGIPYFNGLVVEHPAIDGERLATDKTEVPKGKYVYETAVPVVNGGKIGVKRAIGLGPVAADIDMVAVFPTNSRGYVRAIPPDFNRFLDILYGMERARDQIGDAYLGLPTPELKTTSRGLELDHVVVTSILRGNCNRPEPHHRRVDVDGLWAPLRPGKSMASRPAVYAKDLRSRI